MKVHPQLFEAIAYGDAMGLPYETRTKTEIAALGGVSRILIEPSKYSDFKDFMGDPVGTWSDDTQHAVIGAESIVAVRGFDMRDIGFRLRAELDSAKGWGGTTKKAVGRIHEGMTVQDLRANGETNFRGCGPLMRSAALAIWCAAHAYEDTQDVIDNTILTHNNPDNIASSLTHHEILKLLYQGEFVSQPEDLLDFALEAALANEAMYHATSNLSESINAVRTSDDIAQILGLEDTQRAFTTWAIQATAYAVFVRRQTESLEDVVVAAVEEGGDTDSSASIAACMWAFAYPNKPMPEETAKLQVQDRLHRASSSLIVLVRSVT